MAVQRTPLRLFIACCGLGHIQRGYESFTRECFEALRHRPELDVTLYKGAGASSGQDRTVFTLLRERPLARWIGRFTRGGPYFVEQLTFTLSLLRHVTRQKPDVIFFSDCSVGNILWHWRNRTGQKYRLLFSNGGPLGPPFPRWDHVQQVAPVHFDAAAAAGQPPATMSMLPYGFDIPAEQTFPSAARRGQLRSALGLPTERPCVLSIGAINASHKRMDYVVREVASMAEPRPTLVILGQRDHETHAIEQLAAQLLAPGTYRIATVEQSKVADYYDAADVFVLASLFEGYGRVLPEALARGLACIAHDYDVARFVLGEEGLLADLRQPGALRQALTAQLQADETDADRIRRRNFVREHFGWEALAAGYVRMVYACAGRTLDPHTPLCVPSGG